MHTGATILHTGAIIVRTDATAMHKEMTSQTPQTFIITETKGFSKKVGTNISF
jgi:hypothetical protein